MFEVFFSRWERESWSRGPPLRTVFRKRKESAVTSVACIVFAPFSLAGEPRACPLLYSLIYIVPIGFSCLPTLQRLKAQRERERDPLPQAFFVTGVEGRETEGWGSHGAPFFGYVTASAFSLLVLPFISPSWNPFQNLKSPPHRLISDCLLLLFKNPLPCPHFSSSLTFSQKARTKQYDALIASPS